MDDDEGYSQGDDQEASGGLQSDGKWSVLVLRETPLKAAYPSIHRYGVSATPGLAPGELLQQIQSVTEPSSTSGFRPIMAPPDNALGGSDILQTLIHECGVKPTNINELVEELPSRAVGDALIDYYFRDV